MHSFVCADEDRIRRRKEREQISDNAIGRAWPRLKGLASLPFVRMIAFSGATAHRNMTDGEDLDLFVVVERGKLWSTFLTAILWSKLYGVRKVFCMNYLISDAVMPVSDTDAFTAHQIASLKPIYGKRCYDRFIAMNSFVRRHFPNFDPQVNREFYPEIVEPRRKRVLESLLRCGAMQIAEFASRVVVGWHLRRKIRSAALEGHCDVLLEPNRLKLHLRSHKKRVLEEAGFSASTPLLVRSVQPTNNVRTSMRTSNDNDQLRT